ncbi:lipoxygenase homology domain-containing protein 1-like, partial [Tachysurus ichikawai]
MIKCFERVVRDFITASLPDTLDPLQFAYRQTRSTDYAIAHLLHTTTSHLDCRKGNYAKMLFVKYSSVFNTIIPSTLTSKLEVLGLSMDLQLPDRQTTSRMGGQTHLIHHHLQHWKSPGLCSEPPAVLTVHI